MVGRRHLARQLPGELILHDREITRAQCGMQLLIGEQRDAAIEMRRKNLQSEARPSLGRRSDGVELALERKAVVTRRPVREERLGNVVHAVFTRWNLD